MLRLGIVSSTDENNGVLDVIFESDKVLRVHLIEYADMPNIRDKVACVFTEGVSFGICLGRYYTSSNKPNRGGS